MPNEPQVRLLSSSSSLSRLLLTRALRLLEECVLERGHCACRNRARELHCRRRQGIRIQVSCMRCGLWCMRWGVMGETGEESHPIAAILLARGFSILSDPEHSDAASAPAHTHARTPHDVMETSVFPLSKTFENTYGRCSAATLNPKPCSAVHMAGAQRFRV